MQLGRVTIDITINKVSTLFFQLMVHPIKLMSHDLHNLFLSPLDWSAIDIDIMVTKIRIEIGIRIGNRNRNLSKSKRNRFN